MSDGRILWREPKMVRRLRRYESLPVAHLVPDCRPLFVCNGCKFSNILIEICPWCRHHCNTQSAGPSSSVRKRISAPQMLSDGQKEQLQRAQRTVAAKPQPLSDTIAAFDITMPHATTSEGTTRPRRRRHRDAIAYTIALSMASDETDDEDVSADHLTPDVLVANPPATLKRSQTAKSKLSRTSKTPPSPTKTLRRTKRMSVIRQKSSCSLRRKAMLSLPIPLPHRSRSNDTDSTLPRKPSRTRFSAPPNSLPAAPAYPSDPPPPNVPLGHPSRPLYSAIRKNMSRPSTPTGLPTAQSSDDLRARGMRSLDLPPPSREFVLDDFSSDVTRRHWPVRPSSLGYSLSGEIELRMALARGFSDNADEALMPSEIELAEKKNLDVKLKSKVKRFGRGLKDLMMLRI